MFANWMWGRMIGDVACGWRLSWSPRGPAFGIWGVIYTWTFASVLFQFLTNMNDDFWYCPPVGANVLMAVAWVACSLWIWFFSLADSKDVKDGLGWAAILLVVAACCALSAVVWERSWWSRESTRILTVGVPYSLFAGWLVLAASLSVGTFIASQRREPDYKCNDEDSLREIREYGNDRWIPLVLALAGAAFAAGLSDPIVCVSITWGLFWVPRGPLTRTALTLAFGGIVCASILAGVITRS